MRILHSAKITQRKIRRTGLAPVQLQLMLMHELTDLHRREPHHQRRPGTQSSITNDSQSA
jgi:hypothetical protein